MLHYREDIKNTVVKFLAALFLLTAFAAVNVKDASALPAFARKYEMSCNVCHTRQPRLNAYGQRFMENGYQLPGTADGGSKEKYLYGGETNGVTLDDISNFMALRLRADVQQGSLRSRSGAPTEMNVTEDPDIVFPRTVNIFFAGAAAKDISFFFEMEYDTQDPAESAMAFERSILMFDNMFGAQNGTLKIGQFDPSSLYSFPTHRQMLNPVKPIAETNEYPPAIGRIPVLPLAFASKMFGLTTGYRNAGTSPTTTTTLKEGFAILPFEPYLFNAPVQKGVSLHGRIAGNKLLYQVGLVQNNTAETVSKTRWDKYAMLRYDWLGEFSNFQVSGFYYNAPKAAMPTLNMGGTLRYANSAVDWNRYGLAARWQAKSWDIYGTVIVDEIDEPDYSGKTAMMGGASTWEKKAMGISLEADYLLDDKWLLGVRYDQMSSGGLLRGNTGAANWDRDLAQDAAFLGLIAKYYPSPNIGLYARYHHNLKTSVKLPTVLGGDENPATNLTSMVTVGVDMAF